MPIRGQTLVKPVSFKFGSEGSTTTSITYVTIADSDIALDPSNYAVGGRLFVKFIYHIYNSGAYTTSIQVYRQNAATAVTGSEKTMTGAGWAIVDTGWIDWSSESGNESYQIQLRTSDALGTAEYNSAIMLLSHINY